MNKQPKPHGATCDSPKSNSNVPARVHWRRAELLAEKKRQQAIVDTLGSRDRPLDDAERERLLLALRNIRAITKAQRAWRGGRL